MREIEWKIDSKIVPQCVWTPVRFFEPNRVGRSYVPEMFVTLQCCHSSSLHMLNGLDIDVGGTPSRRRATTILMERKNNLWSAGSVGSSEGGGTVTHNSGQYGRPSTIAPKEASITQAGGAIVPSASGLLACCCCCRICLYNCDEDDMVKWNEWIFENWK